MAEGIEVARAIVTIVPSMEGSQGEMTKQLSSAGETAGEKAGKESGSKFTSSFGAGVKKGAKVMATAVTAAVAGTTALVKGIYDAASATAAYGDNIDKMSQKIGLSSDAYQEWDFIAQHSGTSMESLKMAMTKLSTAAANGSDAFQKLGISTEEAQKMSREELWNRSIMALTGIEDSTERARVAQELFGKGATEMGALLNTSAADLEAMRQQAHDLGIVMSEEDVKASAAFQDSLQNMTQSFDGLKNRMTAEFLPGITTVMDGLTQIFAGNSGQGIALIREGIAGISEKIKEVLPTLIETGGEIFRALLGAISDSLPMLVPLASDILATLGGAIVEALPTLVTAGADIIVSLVGSVIEHAPELIDGAIAAVGALTAGIVYLLPTIITKGGEMITKLVEGISGETKDGSSLFTTISTAMQNIVGKLGEILPDIFAKGGEIVGQLVNAIGNEESGLPNILKAFGSFGKDIIAALDEHAPGIAEAVKTIMSGFEPFIPAIQDMVKTVAEKLPEIIDSFNGVVGNISPIIDSIKGLITSIGDTVVNIVDSIGSNLGLIVEAFSGFNESLATPIESIGTAISGIVTSISDGVATINDSIANILEKLSGVFESIGDAAIKAGDGFSTVADAAIKLANQTNVFDLVATLGGIARGIGDITNKANDMANKNIAEKLETLGPALQTIVTDSAGVTAASEAVSALAESISSINNAANSAEQTKRNIEKIRNAVKDFGNQSKNSGNDIDKALRDAKTDFNDFNTSVTRNLTDLESNFRTKSENFRKFITDAVNSINALSINLAYENISAALGWMQSDTEIIADSISTTFADLNASMVKSLDNISVTVSDRMSAIKYAVTDAIDSISQVFQHAQWSTPYIKTPHFYWSGVWDTDGSDGYMSAPSLNVSWYDKGGVFTQPTVIGIAEKRPEFVGALDDLRDIVREEAGPHDVTINVYGAEGQDVRTLADIVMERIQHSIDRQEAAFA